tara:strand:+ start:7 stop:417 length:411 start_codon:yes stop_codon:yes gene_type:complete
MATFKLNIEFTQIQLLITFTMIIVFLYYINHLKKNNNKALAIQILLRQSARYSGAAEQDESPLIQLLHANYGAGYLWALKDLATDKEILDSTGVKVHEYTKKIIDIQDKSTKRVSKLCPEFASNVDIELLKIAGDV